MDFYYAVVVTHLDMLKVYTPLLMYGSVSFLEAVIVIAIATPTIGYSVLSFFVLDLEA